MAGHKEIFVERLFPKSMRVVRIIGRAIEGADIKGSFRSFLVVSFCRDGRAFHLRAGLKGLMHRNWF